MKENGMNMNYELEEKGFYIKIGSTFINWN